MGAGQAPPGLEILHRSARSAAQVRENAQHCVGMWKKYCGGQGDCVGVQHGLGRLRPVVGFK